MGVLKPMRGMIRSKKLAALILLCLLLIVIITNIYFISLIVEDKTKKPIPDVTTKSHRAIIQGGNELPSSVKDHGRKVTYERKHYTHQNASILAAQKILMHVRELPGHNLELNDNHREVLHRIFYDLTPSNELKTNDVWDLAEKWVTNEEVVPESAPLLGSALKSLCTSKIVKAQCAKQYGTQLKIMLTLEGNQKAIFKPQWYARNQSIEGPVYAGKDRHNAEVAAFHLGLILGFRKSPLVVGRKISLRREVMPVADQELIETFYQEGNNTCFYGVCYYCGPHDPVCAKRDELEGALVLWLPPRIKLRKIRHPWQRTYKDGKLARWEADEKYCDYVKSSKDFKKIGGLTSLLDLVDAAIFDFLIDNGDRHHFEVIDNKSRPTLLLLDNGKSFGHAAKDHIDILAPLYQCCVLRRGTYERLLLFTGGTLSIALEKSLKWSHIAPVITDDHFKALDRRLKIVLAAISLCLKERDDFNLPAVLL